MGKTKEKKPIPAKMIDVESANIKSIGYDEKLEILYVKFNTDSIYSYYPVPNTMWKNFTSAKSKGAWFHNNIKFSSTIKYRPRTDLY